jgi:hypothetical protein
MLLERWICIRIAILIQITSRIPTAWTEEALNYSVVRGKLTKKWMDKKKSLKFYLFIIN